MVLQRGYFVLQHHDGREERFDTITLSPAQIKRARKHLIVETVYLPYITPASPGLAHNIPVPSSTRYHAQGVPRVTLREWCRAAICAQGYSVEFSDSALDAPTVCSITLLQQDLVINMSLEYTPQSSSSSFRVTASATALGIRPSSIPSGAFRSDHALNPETGRIVSEEYGDSGFPDITLVVASRSVTLIVGLEAIAGDENSLGDAYSLSLEVVEALQEVHLGH